MVMFETVKQLLIEEMQVSESDITPEAELVNDLGINSLELADLIMLCEEKFRIEISEDDIQGFLTVADVVSYIEKKTA
jgi:acyl carrier protein